MLVGPGTVVGSSPAENPDLETRKLQSRGLVSSGPDHLLGIASQSFQICGKTQERDLSPLTDHGKVLLLVRPDLLISQTKGKLLAGIPISVGL